MEIKLFKLIQSFVRFVYLSFVSECRRNKKIRQRKNQLKRTQNKHTNNQNMRAFFMLFYQSDEEFLRPDPR